MTVLSICPTDVHVVFQMAIQQLCNTEFITITERGTSIQEITALKDSNSEAPKHPVPIHSDFKCQNRLLEQRSWESISLSHLIVYSLF